MEYTFEQTGIGFQSLLTEAAPFENEAMILDYALFLRELFRARDSVRLLEEFSIKMRDYALAYHEAIEDNENGFVNFLNSRFFPARPNTDFDREHIITRPHCGSRVWEVLRKPEEELFQTMPGKEGGNHYLIPVYVAAMRKGLKVVR